MKSHPLIVHPSLLIFSFWIAIFALIFINGVALNIFHLPANAWIILVLILIELSFGAWWLWRQPIQVIGDPLELAGFLCVVIGTWSYFVYPSLPTLLPPSLSGDGANHIAYTKQIFNTGIIFGDYPALGALIAATFAHWIAWLPLRLVHPLGALWIALSAGGMYCITCMVLPDQRRYKIVALFAAAALFVSWNYFAGILILYNYFWTQVLAHLFVIAFIWILAMYLESRHPFWIVLMGLCLLGIGGSYPLWLPLPILLVVWATWRHLSRTMIRRMLVIGIVGMLLLGAVILVTGGKFIPSLDRFRINGNVMPPSLENFGGWLVLLPAFAFLPFIHAGYRLRLVVPFFVFGTLETLLMALMNLLIVVPAQYWVSKSYFILIFPLATLAVIPFAWLVDRVSRFLPRTTLLSVIGFIVVAGTIIIFVPGLYPPPVLQPLSENEIQVAQWAKEYLNTNHVNYIGTKSLAQQYIGVAIWDEVYPDDLFIDSAALGPRTFEEWRDTPDWGEYVLVSTTRFYSDPAVQVIYQRENISILRKRTIERVPLNTTLGHFGNVFSLGDYKLSRSTLSAGETISLATQVETLGLPAHHIVWRFGIRDLQHDSVAEATVEPFNGKFPLHRWPLQVTMTQTMALALPRDIAPGVYDAELGLYYFGSGDPLAFQSSNGSRDNVVALGKIKVALPPVSSNELGALTRTDAQVGDAFTLLGYRLSQASVHPGESFDLGLYWQSARTISLDYTVFVHVLDRSGTVIAQRDTPPRNGTYPTSVWEPGEIIPDPYKLTLPNNLAPSEYRIEIGMYAWPSLQRLPVLDANRRAIGDHIILPVALQVK